VKLILSPSADQFLNLGSMGHLGARYRRLIAVLEGKSDDPLDHVLLSEACRIVLSPFRGNNLIVFGDRLLYEGVKSNIRGGFDMTTRVTHEGLVRAHLRAFESLYDDAEEYTLARYGNKRDRNHPLSIRKAVITGLKDAYARCSSDINDTSASTHHSSQL
jgi:hypothetical protein